MKRSYVCVPAPTVTACKEMARTLIKHDLAYHFPSYEDLVKYSDSNANHYEYLITGILDCRYTDFRMDFEEWIKREIIKIYRNERRTHHEN